MKILITGATGLVGSRFLELLPEKFEALCPDEKELDITNKELVEKYFEANKPNTVVHFAAFTDPKKAELERNDKNGIAWKVNVEGTRNLADAASKYNTFFVHVSTDLIFPSTKTKEEFYDEDSLLPDKPDGLSWYGYTKLESEKVVRSILKSFAIVRIAYPYRAKYEQKQDFARLFINMYDTDTMYPLFTDNTICATFIDDACYGIYKIIDDSVNGVFHFTSADPTSHYEFACYVLKNSGRDISNIQKTLMSEFVKTAKVPRAVYSTLKNEKTQKTLDIKLKTWKEGADTFLEQYKSLK